MLDLMRQQRNVSEGQVQKLDEVSQQLVKQDTSSRNILAVAGEALSTILQVKDMLVQVSQDAINVQIIFNSMCLRSMNPNKELPAIIEDALGRRVPIPPEWLDSLDWEVSTPGPAILPRVHADLFRHYIVCYLAISKERTATTW